MRTALTALAIGLTTLGTAAPALAQIRLPSVHVQLGAPAQPPPVYVAPAPVAVQGDGPTDCEGAPGGAGGQGNTTGDSNGTGTTGDAAAGIGGTTTSSGGQVGTVGTTASAAGGPSAVGTTVSAGGSSGAVETTAATSGVVGAGGTSASVDGTVGGSEPASESGDSAGGCGCSVPGRPTPPLPLLLSGLLGLLLIRRQPITPW